jgi:hypothetical protein
VSLGASNAQKPGNRGSPEGCQPRGFFFVWRHLVNEFDGAIRAGFTECSGLEVGFGAVRSSHWGAPESVQVRRREK